MVRESLADGAVRHLLHSAVSVPAATEGADLWSWSLRITVRAFAVPSEAALLIFQ